VTVTSKVIRLSKKYSEWERELTKPIRDAVGGGALAIQNDAKRAVQSGPKTGKTYRRSAIGGRIVGYRIDLIDGKFSKGSAIRRDVKAYTFHRASAGGEAPATDTGRLVGSIAVQFDKGGLSAKIGVADVTRLKYARRLEFGFIGKDAKGREYSQAARPFLMPAFHKNKYRIREAIEKAIKQANDAVKRARGRAKA
jgi:hypothetical protein